RRWGRALARTWPGISPRPLPAWRRSGAPCSGCTGWRTITTARSPAYWAIPKVTPRASCRVRGDRCARGGTRRYNKTTTRARCAMTSSDNRMDRELRGQGLLAPSRSVWPEVELHLDRLECRVRRSGRLKIAVPAVAASLVVGVVLYDALVPAATDVSAMQ